MSDRKRKGKDRAAEQDADPPDPVTAQLVFDRFRPFCAPLQQMLMDIPVLRFNLAAPDFLAEYIRVINCTLARARAIAPALLLNKPITPMGNPCNRPKPYKDHWKFGNLGNSHYIIEMRCTKVKDGKFVRLLNGMKVQILFCDYNGYQVGFRRYLNGVWSAWYYCSRIAFPLPFFLTEGAIKLPFGGDYTIKPDIGGKATFLSIFRQFGDYPECQNGSELLEVFLASAVVLCEARRIIWIFMEVQNRIRWSEAPRPLDCNLPGKERTEGVGWVEIGDWSNDCSDALVAARDGEYKARTTARGFTEDEESGHLSLLMRHEKIVAPEDVRTKLMMQGLKLGAQVVDPGFSDDPDPPEDRMPA